MATAVKISLEEYLNTSYEPDVEYLDGELKEKSVVTPAHGATQILLGVWFHRYKQEWNVISAAEARTQVDASHVRLPDFALFVRTDLHESALTNPPLIAIEVLSPSDKYSDLKDRAADLQAMGVRNIWLIDPRKRTCEIWGNSSWQLHSGNRVEVVDSPMFLDLSWLWNQLYD